MTLSVAGVLRLALLAHAERENQVIEAAMCSGRVLQLLLPTAGVKRRFAPRPGHESRALRTFSARERPFDALQ